MSFTITLYPSIYDITKHALRTHTWSTLIQAFGAHLLVVDKATTPGFGPYALQDPPFPCAGRHRSTKGPIKGPHRCELCVRSITLATYDVDTGTLEEVERCDKALQGVSRIWYSTHSYRPEQEKPSLRLLIPLSAPVDVAKWPSFRSALADRYNIPYAQKACGGASHFYYLPSCPPDVDPIFDAHGGKPLDVESIPAFAVPGAQPFPSKPYQPPPEPETFDLAPLRNKLSRKASGLARRSGTKDQEKAELIRRCLDGEPLAQHGARNSQMYLLCGMLAYFLPEASLGALMHLVTPSLEAMIAEGSSLSHTEVEAMCLNAMGDKAAADERAQAIDNFLTQLRTLNHEF